MTELVVPASEQEAYDRRLEQARASEIETQRKVDGSPVIWAPQEGSQTEFLSCPLQEVLFHGTRGPGKGLPLDEPVYTMNGPTRIGDVRVGTLVLCPDGTKSKVIGVFPQGVRPTFEITFDDGAIARCDDVHIWPIHVQGQRTKRVAYAYRNMVMTEVVRRFKRGDRLHVPTLDVPAKMIDHGRLRCFPVDPYLLGLLLGDGSIVKGVRFSTGDDQLADEVVAHGFKEDAPRGSCRNFRKTGPRLRDALASLRLMGTRSATKFVPRVYRIASPATRLAVLQGLMDTDGTVDRRGYVSFCSKSPQLAKDVQELVWSLGGKATITTKVVAQHGSFHNVYIQAGGKFDPFRLSRKRARIAGYQHARLWRRIVDVRSIGVQETVCIKIDHPLGLFITRDFVVTHNTDALLMAFAQHVGKGFGAAWRGIIFRQTYPQLADVQVKSEKWFRRIFPRAEFNRGKMLWRWPGGEELLFRHMAKPADYWCVDAGDVLTADGWLPIEDVEVGDLVLSCDPKSRKLEWLPVATKTVQQYSGELVRYCGRGAYMSFTPNHRLVTDSGDVTPYIDLPRISKLAAGGWSIERPGLQVFDLPGESKARDRNPWRIGGDDFCELMGWWLSEGWVLKRGRNVVGIAQVKEENRAQIRALLTRIGLRFNETPVAFVWRSRRWANWLRLFGGFESKFVPAVILNRASRDQLRIFFDAFIAGDGSRQGARAYAFTSSAKLRDCLMHVGVLLGYSPHCLERNRADRMSSFQIAFNPRTARKLYTDNRERVPAKLTDKTQVQRAQYDGPVYCLGLRRNHTFFVRQKGSVWLSGNSYHGHEYPFVGWEELTNWPTDECYRSMFSCCRSSSPKVPRMVRATTNPYGVGHNWVKSRFRLHGQWWRTVVITDAKDLQGNPEPSRCAIHGHIRENRILLEADPEYVQKINAAASNEAQAKAWLEGSWDVVAGGMFDDVWDPRRNVVPKFDVPKSWRIDRAFDWGSSRPFSVGWYAESDGGDLRLPDGRLVSTVRGDLFRVREWYGWTGRPNEGQRMLPADVAKGIVEREVAWGWRAPGWSRVRSGPADSSIYTVEAGPSIALQMEAPVRIGDSVYPGVQWERADKRPGSRKTGWEAMRSMIRAARPREGLAVREDPALFVVGTECPQFLRTVLSLPRNEKDLDDVDTDAEDHVADEVRYRVRSVGTTLRSTRTTGLY